MPVGLQRKCAVDKLWKLVEFGNFRIGVGYRTIERKRRSRPQAEFDLEPLGDRLADIQNRAELTGVEIHCLLTLVPVDIISRDVKGHLPVEKCILGTDLIAPQFVRIILRGRLVQPIVCQIAGTCAVGHGRHTGAFAEALRCLRVEQIVGCGCIVQKELLGDRSIAAA